MKKKYPIEDGWFHATLNLKTDELLSEKTVKDFLCGSKTELYEFAHYEQKGRQLKAVFRKKGDGQYAVQVAETASKGGEQ